MSVTKTRPSGLCAMKRTRLRPCAATLTPKPSGRFKSNDLPLASVMRWGFSAGAPALRETWPKSGGARRRATAPTRAILLDVIMANSIAGLTGPAARPCPALTRYHLKASQAEFSSSP
jgi:hypothetical protein